ncbi:MAG: hypothetical protein K0R39_3852 [Symbiobacteriaceae bacterium]|nr:hypothetical protein [Symbiobacteriaceae bacterium]
MLPNKVIITGTLHKQIFFVADDDLVRHMGEDIPFTTFVDLPGINPGDAVNIMPIVEHVGFELTDACDDDTTTDCGCDDDGTGTTSGFDMSDPYMEEPVSPIFRRLIQRTVIQLVVRGSEEQPIRLATAALPATVVAGTSC